MGKFILLAVVGAIFYLMIRRAAKNFVDSVDDRDEE
jgi:hypothetical protein